MSFSEKLKQARIKSGYTQQQVADLMGITNSTYCGYEIGKRQPDVAKIKMLSKILNTSGDYLLETGFEKELQKNQDSRLQDIIHCYNNMTEEGKNLLLGQAQFYHQQFIKPKANARAM
ncbi:MAG: helix-turn-helix transcriptional regulator [Lachnospiraceae bacterium]|nr:helix-turn-helix transcriptional regulator [Lachnospiraceae bacterium]